VRGSHPARLPAKRLTLGFLTTLSRVKELETPVGCSSFVLLVRASDTDVAGAPSTRARAAGPKTAGGGRPREEPAALVGLFKQPVVRWRRGAQVRQDLLVEQLLDVPRPPALGEYRRRRPRATRAIGSAIWRIERWRHQRRPNGGRHQRRQRGTLRQTFGKVQTVQESLGIDYLPGISCNQRR
jgi:hypothetical protein